MQKYRTIGDGRDVGLWKWPMVDENTVQTQRLILHRQADEDIVDLLTRKKHKTERQAHI